MRGGVSENSQKLRELAIWYREYAERAGNPWVWEARLRTAENLERQASAMLENRRRRQRSDVLLRDNCKDH
jgi:hypothetical protein